MGVQFSPLAGLGAARIGLFWSQIRDAYPLTEDQTPVAPAFEPAAIKPTEPVVFRVSAVPSPRIFLLTEDKKELIQIQRDRFLRNWRKVEGNEVYPRFNRLSDRFQEAWEMFLRFAKQESLGSVDVSQCEIAYINHIEREAGWNDLGDFGEVFTIIRSGGSKGFLPPPEVLSWQTRYKLPDGRGRLHVEMNPIFRGRDMKLVLNLSLLARGAPAGNSAEQIAEWFALAHEWAIRAFVELTSSKAHQLWGLKSG